MFLKTGSEWHIATSDDISTYNNLPPGNYVVKYNKLTFKYYLVKAENFGLPEKVYGDINKKAKRIITTFLDREASTGVLLSGDKGSGKTMLAKTISENLAILHGIPTVLINENFTGEEFSQFLARIDQPVMILVDEFEKVYNWHEQSKLLTMLDGTHNGEKLFVITVNSVSQVSEFMLNRPGRFYYALNFAGLEEDFIREYCLDCMNNKSEIDTIVKVSKTFSSFSFDILKTIVEEMNRYDETVYEVMDFLNTKPDFGKGERYNISMYYQGAKIDKGFYSPNYQNNVNIISDEIIQYFYKQNGKYHIDEDKLQSDSTVNYDDEDDMYTLKFGPRDISAFELTGDIVYQSGDYKLVLEKVSKFKLDIKKF